MLCKFISINQSYSFCFEITFAFYLCACTFKVAAFVGGTALILKIWQLK